MRLSALIWFPAPSYYSNNRKTTKKKTSKFSFSGALSSRHNSDHHRKLSCWERRSVRRKAIVHLEGTLAAYVRITLDLWLKKEKKKQREKVLMGIKHTSLTQSLWDGFPGTVFSPWQSLLSHSLPKLRTLQNPGSHPPLSLCLQNLVDWIDPGVPGHMALGNTSREHPKAKSEQWDDSFVMHQTGWVSDGGGRGKTTSKQRSWNI